MDVVGCLVLRRDGGLDGLLLKRGGKIHELCSHIDYIPCSFIWLGILDKQFFYILLDKDIQLEHSYLLS